MSSIAIPSEAIPPSHVLSNVFKGSNGFPDEDLIAANCKKSFTKT